MEEDKIIIYQTEDGQTQIDVRLENETVWLTQQQMVQLFKSSRTNILEHIQHIYEVEELDKISTCRNFRQVQKEGNRMVNRTKTMYNLDMIISVGYRVNTKRGIKFRQWANKVLKQYLIKGYAVNDRIRKEQIGELRQLVGMLGRTIQNQSPLSNDETNALFEVVTNYTYALDTLDNAVIVLSASKQYPLIMEETSLATYIAEMCTGESHFIYKVDDTLGRELRLNVAFYSL